MRVAVYTLGCKLNQVESEGIADAFSRNGFTLVSARDEADLYIISTCTVTGKAEQKARRVIRKAASLTNRPVVIVTGCYAELDAETLQKLGSGLFVVPLHSKAMLVRIPECLALAMDSGMGLHDGVRHCLSSHGDGGSPFDFHPEYFTYHARAFLKIEDGCDNTCTYCRVRLARGPAVSLAADEVIRRACRLEEHGYREIVLTGVNISAYRSGAIGLPELVAELSRSLTGAYLRLSSVEPDEISSAFIEAFSLPQVRPHLHIPVQSGSNRMISLMGRSYAREDVMQAVRLLRQAKEDPFIAVDMITGLPGETDEDFRDSADLLTEMDVAQAHVFPYSPRPGTPLYGHPLHVAESLRDRRSAELREISRRQHERYLMRSLGRDCLAILEDRTGSQWNALTENYIHCRVSGVPEGGAKTGASCRVVIKQAAPYPEAAFCSW